MRRVLAVLAIVSVVLLALPAGAAAPSRVGWWWSLADGPVAPPPPPWVPPGGLYVAGNPAGAEAISAVFVPLTADERPAALTVRVADLRGEPVLGACPVVGEWAAAEGAPLSQAPVVDCSRLSVEGVLADDASVVTFDLSGFPVVGGIDVALQPAAGSTFQLALEPLDDSSMTVAPAPPTTVGAAIAPSPPSTSAAPAFVAPAAPSASTFVAAPTTTAVTSAPVLVTAPAPLAATPPAVREERDALRVLGMVGLAGVAALWTVDARRRERPPRLLFDLPEL